MQFQKSFKQAIAAGHVTLTFRTWKKPQATEGRCYNIPPYGALQVTSIKQVKAAGVTDQEASRAGFDDVASLLSYLRVEKTDLIWRVEFEYRGLQEVNRPDQTPLTQDELQIVLAKLHRWDQQGAWTGATLNMIAVDPGRRAAELAPLVSLELPVFKRKVRQLKGLGLTESLEVGYRLTARGKQVVKAWTDTPQA